MVNNSFARQRGWGPDAAVQLHLNRDANGKPTSYIVPEGHPGYFWIWDGMDALQPDAATHAALIEFLREARSDGTRFLLTSRKVEEWPPSDTVVVMDALGFDDRVRFARATCEAYGQTLTDPNELLV